MKKYHKDSNTVLCIINNKTDIGKKLLKVLDNDKVYITFIFIYDDKDNSIKFERAALCLGTVGNHMLFIKNKRHEDFILMPFIFYTQNKYG